MPQYKKVFDIGTYTGNGGQYRVGIPTLRPPGPTGTQVAGSTRFRAASSTYLSRTFALGNRRTFTWSGWVKRGSSTGVAQWLFDADNGSTDSTEFIFGFSSSDTLNIGGSLTTWRITTQLFKDVGAWYHIVAAIDTTQATANNRIRIYVNGSEVTSFSTLNNPTQNLDLGVNQAITHYIGIRTGLTVPLDGYLSELYFVDGQQLTPSSFGEYNSDGIWVPKAYSGTYGTNGFYLPMNNSTNFKNDQSGNSNNWTPVGFNTTTANTTYDIMTDSPTDYLGASKTTANNAGNYCTMNPKDVGTTYIPTFSNGNLKTVHPNNTQNPTRGTLSFTSGKWYFEATLSSFQYNPIVGVMTARSTLGTGDNYQSSFGTQSAAWGGYGTGRLWSNGSVSTISNTFTTNDVIMIAFDVDNGKFYMGKNGSWIGSANPSAGTGNNATFDHTDPITPFTDGTNNDTWILNFGQQPFAYTVPTGFVGVNTYNITRPADSSLWFYGDTPDLMWIKNRSTTGLHTLTDTVRGVGLNLVTSSTAAETSYPGVTEMNKFGMSIINDATSILNGSTNNMVYWGWKAGSNTSSTAVSNASGNASNVMVSSNPSAGFSIVTYTGNGLVSTVGHGLGTTPSLIFGHSRSRAGERWPLWHTSAGTDNYFELNSTAAVGTGSTIFRSSAMSSTVFGIGANASVNNSGDTYVMYCFAAIPGYSAFGSYTGNGSSDGPFIYTGFRPRWILIKNTQGVGSVSNWLLFDTTRNTYNVTANPLLSNTTGAEAGASNWLDLLSNGFKMRISDNDINYSSHTFIYAAFAEIPFKYARSR